MQRFDAANPFRWSPHPTLGGLLTPQHTQQPQIQPLVSLYDSPPDPDSPKPTRKPRTMSQNGGDASKASSPGRPRHQITRSISELKATKVSSPMRLRRYQSQRVAPETEQQDSRAPAPQSAIPLGQGKPSFEWSRSEGVTPNQTPSASRRTSVLYASADEAMPPTKAPRDNGLGNTLVKEQRKAAARER